MFHDANGEPIISPGGLTRLFCIVLVILAMKLLAMVVSPVAGYMVDSVWPR